MPESIHRLDQRISIVGTTGSGKTTLARQISQYAQIPHIELDALYWEPNWTAAPEQVFQKRVIDALEGDRWIVDGNYSKVRSIVWGRADTIIFLDYSFKIVFGRLLRRTLRRSLGQEDLWNSNQESIRKSFFSRDSILLWMLQTYSRHRKRYPVLFQQPQYSHLSVIHLQSPKITETWLSGL